MTEKTGALKQEFCFKIRKVYSSLKMSVEHGSKGMLPQKIFKIQGPRLAKNAFSEISAWKNWIKVSQHVALLLNLGVSKNCLLDLGDWGGGGGRGGIAPR